MYITFNFKILCFKSISDFSAHMYLFLKLGNSNLLSAPRFVRL